MNLAEAYGRSCGASRGSLRRGPSPDHRFTFSVSPDSRPWWRIWNDYPNPTRDAVVGALGIAIIVIAFWFLTAR
jgi:hypothetical protein